MVYQFTVNDILVMRRQDNHWMNATQILRVAGIHKAKRAKILEKVKQLKDDFDKQTNDVNKGGLARFEAAAATELAAVEFYLACQKIVIERTPDLDPSNDKQDAKAAQERVKQQVEAYEAAPGKATALKTELEFLVLTLKAPTMSDKAVVVAKLRDVVGKAMNVVKTFAGPNAEPLNVKKLAASSGSKSKSKAPTPARRSSLEEKARHQIIQTMQQDVMKSIFAQAYNLKNYSKPLENWGVSPLDLSTIYEGFVIPWTHDNKSDDLPAVWEEYVGHVLALHRCEEEDPDFAKWGITGYKELLWDKSFDLLTYGKNRAQSLDELGKLIKENPSHPKIKTWVEQLTALADALKPPAATPEPAK